MSKFFIKNYYLFGIVITIASLLFASTAATISLLYKRIFFDVIGDVALIEIIFGVLVLAVLTTEKVIMSKVVSIIMSSGTILTNFVIALNVYSNENVALFAAALIMVITSVLALIYSLSAKEARLKKLFIITSLALSASIIAYGIIYIIQDIIDVVQLDTNIHLHYYFIIFSFACLSSLPLFSFLSISQKRQVAN